MPREGAVLLTTWYPSWSRRMTLDDCRQTHPASQPREREGKKALRSPTVTLHLRLASRFYNWPGPSHTPSKWQESQDCRQKGCEKFSQAAELAGIPTAHRPPSCYSCILSDHQHCGSRHSTLHFLESNTKGNSPEIWIQSSKKKATPVFGLNRLDFLLAEVMIFRQFGQALKIDIPLQPMK